MSEKKHTPEPWTIGEYNGMTTILGPDGTPCHKRGLAEAHASQAHAVDCVNACADINPAAVPVMVEALKAVLQSANESYEQEELALWSDDIGRLHKACGEALQLAEATP